MTIQITNYFLVTPRYISLAPRNRQMYLITTLLLDMCVIAVDKRGTGFKSVLLMIILNLITARVSNVPRVFLVRS